MQPSPFSTSQQPYGEHHTVSTGLSRSLVAFPSFNSAKERSQDAAQEIEVNTGVSNGSKTSQLVDITIEIQITQLTNRVCLTNPPIELIECVNLKDVGLLKNLKDINDASFCL